LKGLPPITVAPTLALELLEELTTMLRRFAVSAIQFHELALQFNKASIMSQPIAGGRCASLFAGVLHGVP